MKTYEIESETELVEEGYFVLALPHAVVWVKAKRPRLVSYGQLGWTTGREGSQILDWIAQTICRVRGL